MLCGIQVRKHDRNRPTYSLIQPNSTFVCPTLLHLQHFRVSVYPLLLMVTPVLKCMQDLTLEPRSAVILTAHYFSELRQLFKWHGRTHNFSTFISL